MPSYLTFWRHPFSHPSQSFGNWWAQVEPNHPVRALITNWLLSLIIPAPFDHMTSSSTHSHGFKWPLGSQYITQINHERYISYFFSYIVFSYLYIVNCGVGVGCRIYRLHLCRGVRPPPNECLGYGTKQSDGEASVMLECGIPFHCYHSQVHPGP